MDDMCCRFLSAVAADVGVCSETGVDVLRKGGNAVDAAVATTLCLGVVNGQSSGIGYDNVLAVCLCVCVCVSHTHTHTLTRFLTHSLSHSLLLTLAPFLLPPYPTRNSGGGFMLVRNGTTGAAQVVDFREMAPAAATPDMYRQFNTCLSADSGSADHCPSRLGGLASGVPGELRGLELAHGMHGRLNWSQVVMPSVHLARDGFTVSEHIANSIEQRWA